MPAPATSTDRPPFIATQRLWELNCEPGQEKEHLRPERFRLRRLKDRNDPQFQHDAEIAGWQGAWDLVEADAELVQALAERQSNDELSEDELKAEAARLARERFLTDPRHTRLCLTIGAGTGKTTAARQIRYLRPADDTGHLVLFLDVSELPEQVDDYLSDRPHRYGVGDRLPVLIETFRNQFTADDGPLPEPSIAFGLIHRKIREGKFTLVVDALDQMDLGDAGRANRVVAELAKFLKRYPKTRCVVTGRPYAIQHFWAPLFSEQTGTGRWKFAQVDEFTPEEARQYLGDARAKAARQLDVDLLAVPRFLEKLRDITLSRLRQLRTRAEVYWESLRPMLEEGRARQSVTISLDTALTLFALLGFEMTRQRKSVRVRPGKEFEDFLTQCWLQSKTTLQARPLLGIGNVQEFIAALKELFQLNLGLEHALMDNREPSEVHWQDATLQAFFAAVWVTRFASEDDHHWLGEHLVVNGDDSTQFTYELWRFAAEMPSDEQIFPERHEIWDESSYVAAMAKLLVPGTTARPAVRSTEMIYRCWPTMLRLAGYLTEPNWNEQEHVVPATTAAQRDARHFVQTGQRVKASPQTARETLLAFLGEFPALLRGTDESAKTAREFDEEWFVKLNAGPFWMGGIEDVLYPSGPLRAAEISAEFQLAKYPVTNELYALFDGQHAERFDGYTDYSGSPRCPAIYINWYDAWCAATWLHGRLPDEYEWEYACRGQRWSADVRSEERPQPTQWCFGDEEHLLGEYAWYAANSGEQTKDGKRRTHPVGEKRANAFGLHDLHGNVWEWTSSSYHKDPRHGRDPLYVSGSRVLRGGAFHFIADYCRSAFRDDYLPTLTVDNRGFRVARA